MAFKAIPDTAKVVIVFEAFGKEWTNTFHYRQPDFVLLDMQNLAFTVDSVVGDVIIQLMSQDTEYVRTVVYDMREENGPIVTNNTSAGPGTQAGAMMPISDAMVFTLRTGARGKSARGRLYMAGFGEDKYDSPEWDHTVMNAVKAIIDNLHSAALVLGWDWVVASRWSNKVERAIPVLFTVLASEVRSYIEGKQGRRTKRP